MLQANVPRKAGRVHKYFSAKSALFRYALVDFFGVPVQRSLCGEHFATVAKYFFLRFGRPIRLVNALVLAKVGMTLEPFATNVAYQRRFPSVNSHVFLQLVGRTEQLLAE